MKEIFRIVIGVVILYFSINWIADNPQVMKVIRTKMNTAVTEGIEAAKEAAQDALDTASQELDK